MKMMTVAICIMQMTIYFSLEEKNIDFIAKNKFPFSIPEQTIFRKKGFSALVHYSRIANVLHYVRCYHYHYCILNT